MTQVGEGHETAADADGPVMTFGAPTVGEILAERYQLEQHVNNDSAGRQVWRGIDVVLRRPVAVVLRYPGGAPATEMLQAAVDASRVIHPNLVGVYDAIDEGTRAYVVREWVDGESLRELVTRDGPLDPNRATAIALSVTDALTAVHATGMVHGNVHPGTILIGDDGRVVLADARADSADNVESDIRAVGGILYFALTGRWPHAEVGPSALPDAHRDGSGNVAAPRQIRAGVPAYLDDLSMDLLDRRVQVPQADALTAELARLDAAAEPEYEDVGPLRFTQSASVEPVRSTKKIIVGVAALAVIAIVGLVFGIRAISDSGSATPKATTQAQAGGATDGGTTDTQTPAPSPTKIALTPSMVRIVDPPPGSRGDSDQAKNVVDNNTDTSWTTSHYNTANFGNLKKGMGLLINLGTPRSLSEVRVETSSGGVGMDIRTGNSDPGDNSPGDAKVASEYKKLGDDDSDSSNAGTNRVFSVFDANTKYQYVLVWITSLPHADDDDRYQVSVNEVSVYGY